MVNQQLVNYIKQQLQAGVSVEQITSALLAQGWQQQDINEGFSAASSPYGSHPAPSPTSTQSLLGIRELFSQAWTIYKQRLGTFLGIMILPTISVVALTIILVFTFLMSLKTGNMVAVVLMMLLLALMLMVAPAWGQTALLYAVKDNQEKIGVVESYRRGWHMIVSYWWILFLSGFIVTGGFLLFIVPGIIFAIWFSFALFVLIAENLRGMNAVLKSREYVRGRWGSVFVRFLFVLVLYAIPAIAIKIVFGSSTISLQIANALLALFLTPLLTAYMFSLYSNLRALKGDFVFEPPRSQKIKFILVGFAGILVVLALSIILIARAHNSLTTLNPTNMATVQTANARDLKRIGDIISMRTMLSTYYAAHQKYPSASAASTCEPVSNNLANTLGRTFDDPTPGQNYMYAVDSTTNPQRYVLAATLENTKNSVYANSSYTDHPWQGTFLGCNCAGSTYCFLPYNP